MSYADDQSLLKFFIIAYLIPIVATALVILVDGLPSESVVTQISPMVVIVMLSMVHAPTIAAMIASFGDNGLEGIKNLFQQLKYWRFESKWYLLALLIFPLSILVSQYLLTLDSETYGPVFAFRVVVAGSLLSALWEEIGWTGYATPRMLKRLSPIKTAIYLGTIHTFWHLAADYWGAISYFKENYLYAVHFFLWLIGLIILRTIILWMYVRTRSVVLGWLTHFSYTGGQLYLVSVTISGTETIIWNAAFVVVLLLVVVFLFILNKDFHDFCLMQTRYA